MRATALILCGGRATRMGGVDKPLQPFQGRALVHHVIERIAPQTGGRILISANRHLDDYRRLRHPVLPVPLPGFPGPLAGILAGLTALADARTAPSATGTTAADTDGARAVDRGSDDRPPGDHSAGDRGPGDGNDRVGTDWLLVVGGDCPWLPTDLLDRLAAGLAPDHSAAMALGREAPGEPLRPQPLASLIHVRHRAGLAAALDAGERRVEGWVRSLPLARVAFDRPADECAFANINDRSELERLERLDRG